MHFQYPIDGDVLTPAEGILMGEKLLVSVKVQASEQITINNIPCRCNGETYVCEVPLVNGANELIARGKHEECRITVYRFQKAYMKYRLAIDDIIWSLREITRKEYSSIYENAFFAFFRSLYEEFGTKTHFNIYFYDGEQFDLTQFPDRYLKEFEAASKWLQLTFHGREDQPDHIYRYAPYQEIYRDFWQVTEQIKRFAGDNIWRTSANGLHWAETTKEGSRALRDCGAYCQLGSFTFDEQGLPSTAYYLEADMIRHLSVRDFWVDRAEKIIFSRDKLVLDKYNPQEIVYLLDHMHEETPCGIGTMNFVTHEQYFYSFYKDYLPDYMERIRTAVGWAKANGYEPCFISDCLEVI